jgi:hypothetical protein
MATYTDTLGYNKGSAAHNANTSAAYCTTVEMDFAAITAARLAAGATALGAGDILQAIPVPAKTYVLKAGIDVTTAEGATQTFDLGDGDDADGYLDGVNGNTVAGYGSTYVLTEGTPNVIIGYGFGKYYNAADTIDLVQVNACDTAVVRVWAVMVDCSGPE